METASQRPRQDRQTVSRTALFLGFLSLGLLGFGGIAPWARHIIVERRRWLNEHDYATTIGLGQILPGSNTINASVLIGERFQGVSGAVISVVALLTMPLVVLIGLAVLYDRFAGLAAVRLGLGGAAAAAAGMVIGTALKMALKLRPSPAGLVGCATAFVAVGVLRLPLALTVIIVVPLSIGGLLWERRP